MSHDKNVHDKKMHDKKSYDKKENENIIEGRNAVMEAFRSGKPVDKLYVLDGCQDGAVRPLSVRQKSMTRSELLWKRTA